MDYHLGARTERQQAVAGILNEWTLETLLDVIGGLWDHGYQVRETAQIKLLQLACNTEIKPLKLHPKDLARLYIMPGTDENTFRIVRKMKEIGLPAKYICRDFFRALSKGARRKHRESLRILEGSTLYEYAKLDLAG